MNAMKTKLRILILAAFGAAMIFTAGCSGSQSHDNYGSATGADGASSAYPAAAPAEAPASEEYWDVAPESEMAGGGSAAGQPAKIIVDARIDLESKNFERDIAAVKNITSDGKSYFEETNLTTNIYNDEEYRVFYATLRVRAEEYERVKSTIKAIGNLKKINETTEDVTNQYYDSQTRLETKKIEEARVLELIAKAQNVEDIIELESQLADIRLEIEMYTDRITNIDSLTAYSSIHLEIREVKDYSLKYVSGDFGSKLMDGFNKSYLGTISLIQGIVIFLAGLIVPAAIIIVIGAVSYGIMKSFGKLKPKQKTK